MAGRKRDNLIQTRDSELRLVLDDFCEQTNRDAPATLRAIIRLFFAEGFEVAEARLTRRVWAIDEQREGAEALLAEVELAAARKRASQRRKQDRPA